MIKKILFYSIGLMMIFSSCRDNERTEVFERWNDSQPKTIVKYLNSKDSSDYNLIGFYENGDTNFYYEIRNKSRNGLSKFYYKNGQLKYRVNYKDDKFHGKTIFWHKNGQIMEIASYTNGLPDDTLRQFYNNGAIKSIGFFENGNGKIKYYYPTGDLWKKGRLKNGKEQGKWIYYYKNGKKESEGNFTNGLREGKYEKYYKSGSLLQKGIYEKGKIVKCVFYLPNGQIDRKLTDYFKRNNNKHPWTDEQKNSAIENCITDKILNEAASPDEYCKCLIDYIEIFWDYDRYSSASPEKIDSLVALIAKYGDNK